MPGLYFRSAVGSRLPPRGGRPSRPFAAPSLRSPLTAVAGSPLALRAAASSRGLAADVLAPIIYPAVVIVAGLFMRVFMRVRV